MSDRPPPGCVILLLFALALLVACGLLVSLVDGLAPHVAASPVYQYAVCGADQLRAYDGADGYVRAGRWVFVDPPHGRLDGRRAAQRRQGAAAVAHRLPRASARRGRRARAHLGRRGLEPAGGGRGTVRAAGARMMLRVPFLQPPTSLHNSAKFKGRLLTIPNDRYILWSGSRNKTPTQTGASKWQPSNSQS